jgi:hypothetical protein
MRYEQIVKVKDLMIARVNTIYDTAIEQHYTAKQITNRYCEIVLQTPEYNKLPYYVRQYINGYRDARQHALWTMVVFSYIVDGARLSLESPEYKQYDSIYIHDNCIDSGCYVWRSDTSKLYTMPKY